MMGDEGFVEPGGFSPPRGQCKARSEGIGVSGTQQAKYCIHCRLSRHTLFCMLCVVNMMNRDVAGMLGIIYCRMYMCMYMLICHTKLSRKVLLSY